MTSGEWEQEDRTKDIPLKARKAVLHRDGYVCRRCGTEDGLTLHHVIPRGRGGDHSPDNLVTVCWRCHMLVEDHKIEVQRISGHWYFSSMKR